MLRILQVVPAYYPAVRYGGPIRSVHGLCRALVKRGHEVHVYTTNADGPANLDVPLDRPVDLDGVQVHYFDVPALRRLFWAPALARHMRRTISTFDVVHLQSVFLWPTSIAARIAEASHVPYLLSPRGMLVDTLIRQKSRLVKTAWINLIERRTLARAAGFHATSALEVDDARALGLRLPQVFCVANGIDAPQRFTLRADGPLRDLTAPYALFVGRIHWKKGLSRLISAWQLVPELPLVIAGNDDEGYRSQLEQQARDAGVFDRIQFVGPVSDEHKWSLYADAEMFVLPSYSENFGNVVAEAMAMSCPVVISPEVGLAPVVQEAQCGVVSSGEPEQFAEAVRRLHADAATRQEMGRAGKRAARDRLSWDAVAAQMEDVYTQMMASAEFVVVPAQS